MFAVLSLLLSSFALVRPVLADHGTGTHLQESQQGTSWDDEAQNANCEPEDLDRIQEGEVLWHFVLTQPQDSSGQLWVEIDGTVYGPFNSEGSSGGTLQWYVITGPGTLDDAWTDVEGGNLLLSHICNKVVFEGSILVHKVDAETLGLLGGAVFELADGTPLVESPAGVHCVDGLEFGEYFVHEMTPPANYHGDPDSPKFFEVDSVSTCEDRVGDTPDLTFHNEEMRGSILVHKIDEDTRGLVGGATFELGDGTPLTEYADGVHCIDGLSFGQYTVTETVEPAGYLPADPASQDFTVGSESSCDEVRLAGAADLTFENERIAEEGSITIVKEVDCEVCETLTIGYWFNAAGVHDAHADALFASVGGISADGILFTSAAQVRAYVAADISGESDGQPGLSMRGQLTIQYLAAMLNVLNNGDDCALAERIYNNPDSPFDGWTVGEILDEAERAFAGTSEYSDEDIKNALDEINNSTQLAENPLTCNGDATGTLDGVTFDLYLESEYPGGSFVSRTTGDDGPGTAVFSGLVIGETYVIVESGFPDGVTCEIVGVSGGDAQLVDGVIVVTLTEESLDENLNLTLTVENDCEERQDEEFGSLLIAKEDEAGALLGGATFEVDGLLYADEDGDGFVCVDGLTLGSTVSVEETIAPDGYIGEDGTKDVPILNDQACETRLAGEDPQTDADVTFVNVAEEEDLGEVTIIKDLVDCEICETATPGRWFNFSPGTDTTPGTTFANASLGAEPITVAGITFTSVDDVHTHAAPGSLLWHWLGLQMNVRWGEASDCDLLQLVYMGADEDFHGWTVEDILAEAETVLNGGSSEYSAEQLKDVIDEINSSNTGDGTLVCPAESGGVAGANFEFELWVASDYPNDPPGPVDTGTTDGDGMLTFSGLTLGVEYLIVEVGGPNPDETCRIVSADAGDFGGEFAFDPETGQITFTLTEDTPTITIAITNECEGEVDEGEGELEIIKIFCPTVGNDLIFVFGPLVEEPIDGFGIQGMDDEDELPSTEGCTLGAPSEDALGAWFEITGGDLTEPLVVQTSWNEILTLNLAPGSYVITELGTELWAEFQIVLDGDTAVVVFNFLAEEEEDQGRAKILKFFCTGEGDPVFTIVNGDVNLGDPGVTLPANCANPVVGDASFTLTRGALTSAVFTLGDDGARLIPLDPATYVLNEVAPNQASSPAFAITANETTTVIVWNFEGEGEGPGEEVPRGGELPSEGGPGEGQLPDTATAPGPMGSVPAALLALVMLTGLGAAGYAMQAEARRRR